MQTPIVDMLKSYADKNATRFHMPGHKGQVDDFLYADLFDNVYPYDVTELDFSDNLTSPSGVIKQAQDLYAEAYGAENCFFTTNGSTCGILSFVASAEDTLLVERASHASVFNAMRLFGKEGVVLNNDVVDGKFVPATLCQIKECVQKHPSIKSVLLTSPNYYGECCDLKEMYAFCLQNGLTLYVDGAHGAHFAFSSLLPDSIAKHCDACVVSTHKTLPAMTQTACVFAKDEVAQKIKQNLNVFNSSSPNYVLMASMDFARGYLQNKVAKGADKQTYEALQDIKSISHLSFASNDDFTRLVIDNTDGRRADGYLKQNGVYPEFCDLNRVVLIVSLAESEQNLARLKQVLQNMPLYPKKQADCVLGKKDVCDKISFADDGEQMLVDIDEADGYICAEQCGGYPPCIPLFLRGEKIYDAKRLKSFDGTFGVYEKKIRVYKK